MAWFRCDMRGENFPGEVVASPPPKTGELLGFLVTRFVEASTEKEAEEKALQMIRDKLVKPPGYTAEVPAKIYFDEIYEVAAKDVMSRQPGMVFYPMNS